MKKLKVYGLLGALVITNVHADPTPEGEQPTFYNAEGKPFTYYDINGNPLPLGTKIFLGMDARGGPIMNADGTASTGEVGYASKEIASYWKERGTPGLNDSASGGAVFGPSAPASSSSVVFKQDEYDKKVFELNGVLFAAKEIGANACKPAGDKMPGSLSNWWSAVKEYSTGEVSRDELLNTRIAALKEKMEAIILQKASKELQLEAIQIQIDSLNVSIDSISGTNYYTGDGQNAASTGRIPLREKLILAAKKSGASNAEENLKNVDTYNKKLIEAGLNAATKIAGEACERKKKVQQCETVTTFQGRGEAAETTEEVCKEVEVADPVPGCKEALAEIPGIISGPVKAYADIYLLPKVPSRELNNKMSKLEDDINAKMMAIPKSSDEKYDWSTPMQKGIEEMRLARKEAGAICPSSANRKSYDRSKLDTIAEDTLETKPLFVGVLVEGVNDIHNAAVSGAASASATNQMNDAIGSFVNALGVSSSKEAVTSLTEAWNTADLIIGQAGQRGNYFTVITEKVGEVLVLDKAKVAELVAQRAKLEKYLSDLKKELAAPKANPSNGSGSLANNTPKKTELAVQGGSKMNAVGGLEGNVYTIAAMDSTLDSLNNLKNIKEKVVSPEGPAMAAGFSNLSVLGIAGGNMTSNTLGLSSGSQAVAKKYDGELDKVDAKLASLKSSGPSMVAEKTKGKSTQSFSDSLKKAFDTVANSPAAASIYKAAAVSKTLNASVAAGSGTVASIGGGKSSSGTSASDATGAATYKKSYEKDLGYSYSSGSDYSGSTSRSSSSYRTVGSSSSDSSSSAGVGRGIASVPGQRSQDSKMISQSIQAKKSKRKDAYQPSENDTLFDRVTKAYIRNYEKVEENPVGE